MGHELSLPRTSEGRTTLNKTPRDAQVPQRPPSAVTQAISPRSCSPLTSPLLPPLTGLLSPLPPFRPGGRGTSRSPRPTAPTTARPRAPAQGGTPLRRPPPAFRALPPPPTAVNPPTGAGTGPGPSPSPFPSPGHRRLLRDRGPSSGAGHGDWPRPSCSQFSTGSARPSPTNERRPRRAPALAGRFAAAQLRHPSQQPPRARLRLHAHTHTHTQPPPPLPSRAYGGPEGRGRGGRCAPFPPFGPFSAVSPGSEVTAPGSGGRGGGGVTHTPRRRLCLCPGGPG